MSLKNIKNNIKNSFLKHKIVFFLLLLSLTIRTIYSATHISFGQDIARDAYLIGQKIDQHQYLVSYGPKASVGNFYLPPFYYQLHLGLSLITNNHPLTMKWFVTLTESLTPVLLFLLLKNIVKEKVAVVVAGLYVFAYQPLTFGVFAWNPNTIPFFILLSLYCLISASNNKKFSLIPLGIVAASIAFQLHYQATVFLPFLAGIFLWQMFIKKWLVFKYWLLGSLFALFLLTPYLVGEYKNNFQNSKNIFAYFSQEHSLYYDRVSKPTYILTFFPKFFDRVMFKHELYSNVIGFSIYFLGGGILLYKAVVKKKLVHTLLLFCFVSILVMLRFYKGDKLDYYLSTLFFWPFILASLILEKLPKIFMWGFFVLIAFLMGNQLALFTKRSNDLKLLTDTLNFLETQIPEKSARFIFHDDDYINTLAYGLDKYTDIKSDPFSLTIVDVCQQKQFCIWDKLLQSKHDEAYGLVADFKNRSNYEYLTHFENAGFKIVIGKVKSIKHLDTSKFIYQGEYGTDFLLAF